RNLSRQYMDDLQDKRNENTVNSISEIEISKEKASDNSNSGIRNTQTEKVENETFQGIQTSDSIAGILTFDISSKQFYKKFVMVLAISCIGFTVL
ncbi:hypothetical protein BB560_006186, partial [Smittium megazygosporum]